ncbi:UNVERIFIED_CONTAM: hypothetical protein FKN15_072932 [Acipenser sinensis]
MLSAVLFTLQANSEASQTCRVGGNTVLPANRSQLTGARSPQESLVQCSASLQYNLPSGIDNLACCNPFQSANQYSYEGKWLHPKNGKILGALNMGGASTQITFTPEGRIADKQT